MHWGNKKNKPKAKEDMKQHDMQKMAGTEISRGQQERNEHEKRRDKKAKPNNTNN
jgi:hypothetical protein